MALRFSWYPVCLCDVRREGRVVAAPEPCLRPSYDAGWVQWWSDPGHQHRFLLAEVLYDSEHILRWRSTEGIVFRFRSLTVERYMAEVRPRGGPVLASDAEIRAYFLDDPYGDAARSW